MATYSIKRYVVETYEVEAKNRKEAISKRSEMYDPSSVTVIKETYKKRKS
jgi:hypothetical protein